MATRVEWTERVERWERSGLSAEKFARREGYKPKQLYWWRWKLRADGPAQPSPSPESPRFLPVQVVADASLVAPEPIEIALPNGRVASPSSARCAVRGSGAPMIQNALYEIRSGGRQPAAGVNTRMGEHHEICNFHLGRDICGCTRLPRCVRVGPARVPQRTGGAYL
ncbi:hypothetical protein WMF38_43505 [Sorangium sp. So ce118]